MDLTNLLTGETPGELDVNWQGGRVSLDPTVATEEMRAEFACLAAPLSTRSFWSAAVEQSAYLPNNGLWAPQRRAVGLSLAYIAAKRTSAATAGAALVKMPTGTGKTGVIATLACAVPTIRRTLVITPRRALVDQMVADLHTRLWSRFGLIYDGATVRERVRDDAAVGAIVKDGPVRRLLPKDAAELSSITDERLVVVGTFAALEQILRPDRPAHRLTGRRPAAPDEIPPDLENDTATGPVGEGARRALVDLLRSFDLVIVDESHYEPAYIWSQCIRSLGLPTVLFSATPYRNDFRYFDIDGRFAFSLSFREASDRRLIRDVRVIADDPDAPAGETPAQRLVRFATEVGAATSPDEPGRARVIVRAETHESLVELREHLQVLGEPCVLIHHKEKRNDVGTLRFCNASDALAASETENVRFWLHQWKLLEGVDDSRFGGVAVYEPFATSRAVVQQIGRVLRYGRRDRDEVALVMGAGDIGTDLAGRFSRYTGYEARFDNDPGDALRRETRFFETLREASPAVQYISGDFRDRLDLDDERIGFADIQLPLRAYVMRNIGGQSLDDIASACALAMGIEDRHDATVLRPRDADEPQNVRLIAYVAWSNSPLLTQRAMPTWNLGVMSLVEVGDRVFLLDTERVVVDPELLGLEPEGPETLQRLVPQSGSGESCRVTVASAISLDISDMGIRSVTARMRDFGTGFYDLAQGMQATTSVRALLKNATGTSSTRYLSLQRSSVSDGRNGYVPVAGYVEWIESIAARLDSGSAPSAAFGRFAQALPAPAVAQAAPQNVLFDFAELIGEDGTEVPDGWDPARTLALADADRCIDVAADGSFQIDVGGQSFDGKLRYEVTGTLKRRGRYVIELPRLDAHLIGRQAGAIRQREKSQLLSGRLTREQPFRVVPADPKLVYAQRHFYRPSIAMDEVARDAPGGPLEAVQASPWLAQVTSEKGEAKSSVADWIHESVFGGVYAHFGYAAHGGADTGHVNAISGVDPAMAALLDEFSIVVCDDGGTETCDFLCVDEARRRVVMIHAKVDDTIMSLNSLQAVGRQAQASLGLLTSIHELHDRTAEWRKHVPIKDGSISRRLLTRGRTVKQAWQATHDALRSARYTREVWIVAGRILQRGALVAQVGQDPPSPRVRQMIYYIASLQTSAARANVGMRIFCSP